MNVFSADLLFFLADASFRSQRELAERSGLSLGLVNRSLQELKKEGLLDGDFSLTERAASLLAARRPQRAVILAAGYGMRMVPVSSTPKALLEVRGERLIERLIRQLQAVGITDISIVVGYRKELFDYLIDTYGVSLIFNPDYAEKNNLFSLSLVADRLENCYVLPCDLWCQENPFRRNELISWYLVSEEEDPASSDVRVSRKRELVRVPPSAAGNRMIGISYLCGESGEAVRNRIVTLSRESRDRTAFWENALYDEDRMIVHARILRAGDAVEINTYEHLRELDSASGSLQADALHQIGEVFGVSQEEIRDISVLKKGMTNRSFLFTIREDKYIMRIPGEG
ncbi:MAG: NTP transferase domain-containing protein, partial [Oscillospiraceae bacterium]|nr:NTP transferase domain-containing protein [Oscillospiraceae bacterium]